MSYRVDGIRLESREKFCAVYTGYTIEQIKSEFDPNQIIIWGIIPTAIPESI